MTFSQNGTKPALFFLTHAHIQMWWKTHWNASVISIFTFHYLCRQTTLRGQNKAHTLQVLPRTHFMMRSSVQENCVVLTRNTCRGWSVMVSFGRFFTPSNRSDAFRTSRPRKMVNDTAWATNFMKGLRNIWPNWKTERWTWDII